MAVVAECTVNKKHRYALDMDVGDVELVLVLDLFRQGRNLGAATVDGRVWIGCSLHGLVRERLRNLM